MRAARITGRIPRYQRGAALLTAMIIVTLVATLAAAMVWQQWRAVQVEAAERARVQSAWILSGALDFAKLILREDMNGRTKQITALTEPWATPLAEARLSTFLAVDKTNADDGPEAFLSGNINDALARYNLTNLVGTGANGLAERKVMERLCQSLSLDVGLAARIANGLTEATNPTSAAAPLLPRTVAQLTWLGIDQASVQALQRYVVLLPAVAKAINVNTASKEVLMAVLDLDASSASRLIGIRQRTPFETVDSFRAELKSQLPVTGNIAVDSNFFEVTGRLRLADRVLTERSLVQRIPPPTRQINVLQRERIASLEQVGA